MKADIEVVNPAFQSIMQNPNQKVFLDANFFIPPDRSEMAKVRAYSFTDFKYQYYLTRGDKRINPDWGSFIKQMDTLYSGIM